MADVVPVLAVRLQALADREQVDLLQVERLGVVDRDELRGVLRDGVDVLVAGLEE
jgi:hypothetical protein